MNQKKFLVIGGQGFIGSHLVDALLGQGHQVRCFDRPNSQIGRDHSSNPNFELIEGSFLDASMTAAALEGCDICYHLVSTTNPKSSNDNVVFDIESNLLGTVHLLGAALKAGIKKIIFISSGGTVYGVPQETPIQETHSTEPICSYGITKLAIEKYLDLFYTLHGLDYCVLRVANPYGELQQVNKGQGAVAVFLQKALNREEIEIWGDGSVVRDYVYIADVVSALIAAINFNGTHRVFNIGSGKGLSLNDVLDSIDKVAPYPTMRRYISARQFDAPANVLAIDRAKTELDWSPRVDFELGLQRFAVWFEEKRNKN